MMKSGLELIRVIYDF